MATKILNTLDSASEKMLKSAKKQLKEEAGKQLMKYKAMIPSKENIKQRLVDEIIKQGKELACSPEGQNVIESIAILTPCDNDMSPIGPNTPPL